MAFDYSELAGVATELIAEFGRAATLLRVSSSPASPSAPWEGATATNTTSLPVTAVFVDPSDLITQRDGVPRGEKFALVDGPAGSDLETYNRLHDGSKVWQVVSCEVVHPGDTRLLYMMGLER